MAASLTLRTPVVSALPGGEGVAELTVRNTGTIVDQFAFNLVGGAAAWARCEPPFVSLFPGAEETIRVHFTPPRSAEVAAGTVAFGVRVTSQEDPDFSHVEEGVVQVEGFSAIQARIVPRTSEGKRGAVHRLDVTNLGNAPVLADVTAYDADSVLAFEIEPERIEVPAGATGQARVKIVSTKRASGGMKHRQFTVRVDQGGQPVTVDATFLQKPRASALWLVAIAIAAAVLAFLLFNDDDAAATLGALVAAIRA